VNAVPESWARGKRVRGVGTTGSLHLYPLERNEKGRGREREGEAWTNFTEQDLTRAKFSILEVAAFMLSTFRTVKQNALA
jgi:hypothetical protein